MLREPLILGSASLAGHPIRPPEIAWQGMQLGLDFRGRGSVLSGFVGTYAISCIRDQLERAFIQRTAYEALVIVPNRGDGDLLQNVRTRMCKTIADFLDVLELGV